MKQNQTHLAKSSPLFQSTTTKKKRWFWKNPVHQTLRQAVAKYGHLTTTRSLDTACFWKSGSTDTYIHFSIWVRMLLHWVTAFFLVRFSQADDKNCSVPLVFIFPLCCLSYAVFLWQCAASKERQPELLVLNGSRHCHDISGICWQIASYWSS